MKNPSISTSKELRKAGIKGGVAIRKGEWAEETRSKRIPGADKKRPKGQAPLQLPKETMVLMAKDKASGMTNMELSNKYGVSSSYIQHSLKTLFLTTKVGKEILKNVLLDNAVASGMRLRETVGDLQPMQAAIVTGIMTQRFIDLEKHTSATAPDMDLTELGQVGQILRDIRSEVHALPEHEEGAIIDVSGDVCND